MSTDFEDGLLLGLLVGEGHFGGDGRQPQVTLRMHERHGPLFRWLERTHPGGRLYGPYEHGGRRYYQWMARGTYLRDVLAPLLRARLTPEIDRYAHDRFTKMVSQYERQFGTPEVEAGLEQVETAAPEASPIRRTPPSSPGPAEGPPSRPATQATRIFAALRHEETASPSAARQGRPPTSSDDRG